MYLPRLSRTALFFEMPLASQKPPSKVRLSIGRGETGTGAIPGWSGVFLLHLDAALGLLLFPFCVLSVPLSKK